MIRQTSDHTLIAHASHRPTAHSIHLIDWVASEVRCAFVKNTRAIEIDRTLETSPKQLRSASSEEGRVELN